jgi:MFS superfamily sulfate permease-like transporter
LTPLFRACRTRRGAIVIAAMHLSTRLSATCSSQPLEFGLAVIVIARLTLGVLQGIALGVALSLLMLIHRPAIRKVRCSASYRARGVSRYQRREASFPRLLIIHRRHYVLCQCDHLGELFKAALAQANRRRPILLDASSVALIATSSFKHALFSNQDYPPGICAYACARDVRKRMRLGGIETVVGSTNFYERVTDGVRAWQQSVSKS